jgi:hypothetical protein
MLNFNGETIMTPRIAMRITILVFLFSFILPGLARGKEESGPAAEKVKTEILKIEMEKLNGLRQNGSVAADWFHRYSDVDQVHTSHDGSVETTAEHEAKLSSSQVAIVTMKQFDYRVRVFENGNVAVVTYKQIGQLQGQLHPVEGVATDVWVKEDVGWQRVVHSSHQLIKK